MWGECHVRFVPSETQKGDCQENKLKFAVLHCANLAPGKASFYGIQWNSVGSGVLREAKLFGQNFRGAETTRIESVTRGGGCSLARRRKKA